MSKRIFFDDLAVGDQWSSQARTITETDVVNFAGLTGDYDPLHVDREYAATHVLQVIRPPCQKFVAQLGKPLRVAGEQDLQRCGPRLVGPGVEP